MTTRTYYLPKNRISLHVLNYIVSRVGCSVGDIAILKAADVLRVPITCDDKDVQKIERILDIYEMKGE